MLTLVMALARLPLLWAGGLLPRDPRLVVFGAHGDRFTDNAKHLFLSMAHHRELRSVWLTGDPVVRDRLRSMGHAAQLRWSLPGMLTAARAGWHVFNTFPSDTNYWFSRGARSLNLWHGIPIKTIQFDIMSGPQGRVYQSTRWAPVRLRQPDRFRQPDYVLSTSPDVSACFSSAFRVEPERCLELGYPRTDHLFAADATAMARQQLGLPPETGAIIGYFPTWRDDGADFLGDAGFSFDRMNDRLAGAGRTMVFKAHPVFGDIAPVGSSWSNVVILDPRVDLNEVLPACDALVTDHSSVAFDYLLLGRPIVYFLPDRDRYEGLRNTYFTIEELAVGPIVTTVGELEEMVATLALDGPPDPRIEELRKRLWGTYDGHACEDIAAFIAAGGRPV